MQLISAFFGFLNLQVLKMQWLSDLTESFVSNVLRLNPTTPTGGAIHFFIYDVIKIFILLSVLIFIISYIQSYFPPEKTKKILGRFGGFTSNILAALLGTVTPFCSCSSIPLFIGFTSAGLPIGTTFSFLISSPLVDLASLLLLASIFNWKIAIAYVVVGLILAVAGGTVISKLGLEGYVEPFVRNVKAGENPKEESLTKRERAGYAREQVAAIVKRVWPYVLIGVGVGALIHNVIPEKVITPVLGRDKWYSVLIASVIGAPMYADIFGTLPVAEGLVSKGVGIGSVLSFMMAVTALSLPSMIMLKKVVKMKLLLIFIAIVMIGIIIIGYIFNAMGFLLT